MKYLAKAVLILGAWYLAFTFVYSRPNLLEEMAGITFLILFFF